jgi:hypothetical protein
LAVFDDRRIELLTRLCLSYRRDPIGDEIESQKVSKLDLQYEEILYIGFRCRKAESLPSSLRFMVPFKELFRDVSDIHSM